MDPIDSKVENQDYRIVWGDGWSTPSGTPEADKWFLPFGDLVTMAMVQGPTWRTRWWFQMFHIFTPKIGGMMQFISLMLLTWVATTSIGKGTRGHGKMLLVNMGLWGLRIIGRSCVDMQQHLVLMVWTPPKVGLFQQTLGTHTPKPLPTGYNGIWGFHWPGGLPGVCSRAVL